MQKKCLLKYKESKCRLWAANQVGQETYVECAWKAQPLIATKLGNFFVAYKKNLTFACVFHICSVIILLNKAECKLVSCLNQCFLSYFSSSLLSARSKDRWAVCAVLQQHRRNCVTVSYIMTWPIREQVGLSGWVGSSNSPITPEPSASQDASSECTASVCVKIPKCMNVWLWM